MAHALRCVAACRCLTRDGASRDEAGALCQHEYVEAQGDAEKAALASWLGDWSTAQPGFARQRSTDSARKLKIKTIGKLENIENH